MDTFIDNAIISIREQVQSQKVILALSGGVDSSVLAVLLKKAIGKNLTCVFVDHGFLRLNEVEEVKANLDNKFNLNIHYIDAKKQFMKYLKNVSDPEKKRKIIGREFIKVFTKFAASNKDMDFLAQGTIYPDVIESQSVAGPSKTIKSHHNVGGLPKKINFKLLEPLRTLFKDEVREIGYKLKIDKKIILRHPFPGPGLAIRIIGKITNEKLDLLRKIDKIFINKLHEHNLYYNISQAFATLLPVKTVGVMGDSRTYGYLAGIRSVDTIDFMSATITRIDYNILEKISRQIVNEVKGVNRVVYDITSKPPSTIE